MENVNAGQIKRGVLSVEQLMVGCVFYTISFVPLQAQQGMEFHWNQQQQQLATNSMIQTRKVQSSQQPVILGNQILRGNTPNKSINNTNNNNNNNYQSAGYKMQPGGEQMKAKTVAAGHADSPLRRVQTDTNTYSSSQFSNARNEMLPSSKQIHSQQQIPRQNQLSSQIINNNNNSESFRILQQQQHYNDIKNTSYTTISNNSSTSAQTNSSQFLKYQVKSSKNSTDLNISQNQITQKQSQQHQQFKSTAVTAASTTAKKRTSEVSSMYEGRNRSQTEQAEEDTNSSEYYGDIENMHTQGGKQTEQDIQALIQFRRRAERSASPFQTTTAISLQQSQHQQQQQYQQQQPSSFGLTSSSREASPSSNKTFKIFYKNNRGHSQQPQLPSAASSQQNKQQQQQQVQQQAVLVLQSQKQQQQIVKQSYSQQNQQEQSQEDAKNYDQQQRLETIQLANQQTQERVTVEEARLAAILEQNNLLREQIDSERTSLIFEISNTQERLTRSHGESEVFLQQINTVDVHQGETHLQIALVLQNMKDTNRRVILGRQGKNIKARQIDQDSQVLDGLLRRAGYFKGKVKQNMQKNLIINEINKNRMKTQNNKRAGWQEQQVQNGRQHIKSRAISEKSVVHIVKMDQGYDYDINDSKYLPRKIDLQGQEADKQIDDGEDNQRQRYFDTFEEYQRLLQEISHLSVMEQTVREKLGNLEEKIKEIELEKEKQQEGEEEESSMIITQEEEADNQVQELHLGEIDKRNNHNIGMVREHVEESIIPGQKQEEGYLKQSDFQQQKQQWKHSQQQDYYYSNAGRDQQNSQSHQGLLKDRHYLLTFNQDQNNQKWELQQKQQEIDSEDEDDQREGKQQQQQLDQGQGVQHLINDNQQNGFSGDDGTIQLMPRSYNPYYSSQQSFEQDKDHPEMLLGGGYISSDSQYLSRFSNNTSTHEEKIREVSPLQIDTSNNEYFINSNTRSKSSSSSSRKINTRASNQMNASVRIYHGGNTQSSSQSGNSISSNSNSQQSSSFGSGSMDNQEFENVQLMNQRFQFQHSQMFQNVTVNDRIAPLFGGMQNANSDRCSMTAGNSPKTATATTIAGVSIQPQMFGKIQQKGSQKSADLLGNYHNNHKNQNNSSNEDINQLNRANQQSNLLQQQLQQSQQLYYNPNKSANNVNVIKQQSVVTQPQQLVVQQQQYQQQAQQYQLEQQQAARSIHKSFDNFIYQQQQQQQQQQALQEQLNLPLGLQRGLSHHEFSGAAKKPYTQSAFSITQNSPINHTNSSNKNNNSSFKQQQLSAAEETLHQQLLNTAPTLFNQYFSSRRLQQQQPNNNSNGISRK